MIKDIPNDEESPAEIGLEECEILHEYLARKLANLDGSDDG